MDDVDGGLSFDFEGGLDAAILPSSAPSMAAPSSAPVGGSAAEPSPAPSAVPPPGGGGNRRGSFRQTVCRHWLRGLCMKGENCGFLHQLDKARMPICRFFRLYGECREQDCIYKHTDEDLKECNMYKMGFCPNGPDCRYRHIKLPGPPPPVEEVFQKLQQMNSFGYGNRFFQHKNSNYNQQGDKPKFQQVSGGPSQNNAVTSQPVTQPNVQQAQTQVQESQQLQKTATTTVQSTPNNNSNQTTRTAIPLPQGISRYFIVKSSNRENLEISVQQGIWATQRSNEGKLNEAFEKTENVILIFSVNRTRHFQGCARMTSKIGGHIGGGNWKCDHGTAHYGRNFSLQWLKLGELSFNKTHHLKNPYNDNLPVKISRDCQELEPSIGEQLASLLYLEPDSELTVMLIAAEAKREEEKAKGVSDDGADNHDIVPFEDNEDEEEEESEDDEESNGQAQVRGRGRGVMWPNPMGMMRGALMPGVRGFPPAMMNANGYGFADGFGIPDMYGVSRVLPPFLGPRTALGPGMVFAGRPQPAGVFPMDGLGMMMGPGRPPFIAGMPVNGLGRGAHSMSSYMHPPLPPNRGGRRDQRRSGSERSERYEAGIEQGSRAREAGGSVNGANGGDYRNDSKPHTENKFQDDESLSEDEAPRRSRHGAGKRKHRSSEADSSPDR